MDENWMDRIRCDCCVYSFYDDNENLTCRRYPPVLESGFPKVSKDMWCGEFKSRTAAVFEITPEERRN